MVEQRRLVLIVHVISVMFTKVKVLTYQEQQQGCITLEYRSTAADGREFLKLLVLDEESLDLLRAECYLDDSLILSLKMERLQWL